MTLSEKIDYLEQLLNQEEQNYADSFKSDIIIFFEDDFSQENSELLFLENLNAKRDIENWIDKLTSRFVMKFDSEYETENDFIYDYLENG
jgi:hypothetical protein